MTAANGARNGGVPGTRWTQSVAIEAHDLTKRYRVWTGMRPTNPTERLAVTFAATRRRLQRRPASSRREIWALQDVSFEVRRGELLGVLGRNGAGKSTLLSILAGITTPTRGRATIHGRLTALMGVGTGFHPELTGRDNVFVNGVFLGMSRAEVARKFDAIVEFSELEDFIDVPVKRYSTGMHARLAFSVAAHVEADILLLDEVLAAGDPAFREKCRERIASSAAGGLTGVLVSHDLNSIGRLCQRALVLERGKMAFLGETTEAFDVYRSRGGSSGDDGVARDANAPIRIDKIRIVGEDGGDVAADRPFRIHVSFEVGEPEPARGLSLRLLITDSNSRRLALLTRRLGEGRSVGDTRELDGETVTCEVDELPVRPGRYLLSAELTRSTEAVDALRDVEFEVGATDFFGTGARPESAGPPLLLRHRWHVHESAASK